MGKDGTHYKPANCQIMDGTNKKRNKKRGHLLGIVPCKVSQFIFPIKYCTCSKSQGKEKEEVAVSSE